MKTKKLQWGIAAAVAVVLIVLLIIVFATRRGEDASENPSAQPTSSVGPTESVQPSAEPESERTPVDPEELIGAWDLYAWELLTGGSYTEVVNQQFVFTENVMDYMVEGTVATHNNYTFTDEYTLHLTDVNNPEVFVDWGIYWEDEVLTFEDPLTGVYYYCRKAEDVSQFDTAGKTPVTSADLIGTWDLYAWELLTGGSYTEVASQQFVFTGDVIDYIVGGAVITHNGYSFIDEYTIRLVDLNNPSVFTDWKVYIKDGILTFEDPLTGVYYYCREGSANANQFDATGKTPVSSAQLAGAWELYAWELLTGGSYTEVASQQFVFTGDVIDYVISGAVITHNGYSFTDEYTIRLVDLNNPSAFTDWKVYMENGVLTFEDPLTGVYYYCRRAAEPDEPSEEPEPEKVAVKPEELVGSWELYAWELLTGGSYTEVANQQFVFTEDMMDYIVEGVVTTHNSYTLSDEYTLHLVDVNNPELYVDWSIYWKDGVLTMEDPLVGVYYYCRKAEEPEPEKVAVKPEELVGSWELYAWELLTGGSYTEVANQQFVFTEDVMDYIVEGTVTTHNSYTLSDEYTLHLVDVNNPELYVDWSIYWKDGVLTMEDPLVGVYYYCRRFNG